MTSDRSWTHRAAMAFYSWLVDREGEELPYINDICLEMDRGATDPYRLALAIDWLRRQDMLDVRRGDAAVGRDHYIIRVRSTGRVYRTVGCPLQLPAKAA